MNKTTYLCKNKFFQQRYCLCEKLAFQFVFQFLNFCLLFVVGFECA